MYIQTSSEDSLQGRAGTVAIKQRTLTAYICFQSGERFAQERGLLQWKLHTEGLCLTLRESCSVDGEEGEPQKREVRVFINVDALSDLGITQSETEPTEVKDPLARFGTSSLAGPLPSFTITCFLLEVFYETLVDPGGMSVCVEHRPRSVRL
jgi:hypothetical protein